MAARAQSQTATLRRKAPIDSRPVLLAKEIGVTIAQGFAIAVFLVVVISVVVLAWGSRLVVEDS